MKGFKIKMEKWECLNEREFKGLNLKRAFWVTGALETHGIGPLGIDIFAPYFIARDLADRFKTILLPSLPFGISRSLTGHSGTVTLTPETFKKVVKEVIYSLHLNKIEELFIFNGHGGQREELEEVCFNSFYQYGIKTCVIHWWIHVSEISEKYFGDKIGHGGADELALVYSKLKFSLKGIDKIFDFKRLKGLKSFPHPSGIMLYKGGKIGSDFSKLSKKYYNEVLKFIENSIEDVIKGWKRI